MTGFLHDNLGNIVILAIVAAAVIFAVLVMRRDKKAGIGACGQKCSKCGGKDTCDVEAMVRDIKALREEIKNS